MGRTGLTVAGKALRDARERMGLTRKALANYLCCTPQTIEAWEYGYRALSGVLDEIADKTGAKLTIKFGAKYRKTPGEAIRELRTSLGLTQDAMGALISRTGQMINKMENGNFCPILFKLENVIGAMYVSYG